MNDLLLVTKFKKTLLLINKIILNYPKSENVLKNNMERILYEILELCYIANYKKDNDRKEVIYLILAKVKILDFYLRISLDKELISYKKFINICGYINEIVKMVYGWLKSNV